MKTRCAVILSAALLAGMACSDDPVKGVDPTCLDCDNLAIRNNVIPFFEAAFNRL